MKEASKINSKENTWSEIRNNTILILGRFWKWYISGFASRPDKAIYESPRFWRIIFTFFIVGNFLGFIDNILPNTSVRSTSSSASAKLCVDNFNRTMSPIATATLDRGIRTMNITFTENLTEAELNEVSQNIADSVFSSCAGILIQAVRIRSSGYVVTVNRP